MYEARHDPVLSNAHFYRRLGLHILAAATMLLMSLSVGMAGYHFSEGMSWLDAFLNSAMLLGGMGPVTPLQTPTGKLFAGCYALYSGLLFVICTALILTPVLHRILHVFHVEDSD